MPVRLGVVLAIGFGVLIAYLASLNTTRVRVALSGDRGWEVPLAALVVGAFLTGVALTLVCVLVRDLGRSLHRYRQDRARRRGDSGASGAELASEPRLESANAGRQSHTAREVMSAPERLTSGEMSAVRSEAEVGATRSDIPRA